MRVVQYGGITWMYRFEDGFSTLDGGILEPVSLADQLVSIVGII